VNEELVAFVKAWEGFKSEPSGDPLVPGVRDIGYGHVLKRGEDLLEITESQADALLRSDLHDVGYKVDELVAASLTDNQRDALLSFTYNLGAGALSQSTLLHLINACRFDAAGLQFSRWCYAGGHAVNGLKLRRMAEQAIFTDCDYRGRP
jgi:lysozyme